MFFSGAQGKGSNLFISYRSEDGTWAERKSMGDIINSVGVRMPVISPDGNFLFFQGGEGCWWMDSNIIEYLRTHDLDFSSSLINMVIKSGIQTAVTRFKQLREQHGLYFNLDEKFLNNKGYKLLRQNKYEEAIAVFRLNVALSPESFNVYDSLGEAYMSAGKKEMARKNYQKSLDLNPDNKNAQEMLKRLKNKNPKKNRQE